DHDGQDQSDERTDGERDDARRRSASATSCILGHGRLLGNTVKPHGGRCTRALHTSALYGALLASRRVAPKSAQHQRRANAGAKKTTSPHASSPTAKAWPWSSASRRSMASSAHAVATAGPASTNSARKAQRHTLRAQVARLTVPRAP